MGPQPSVTQAEARHYELFSLVARLEKLDCAEGNPSGTTLRIVPTTRPGVSATDVERIERGIDGTTVYTNRSGLSGPESPLPAHLLRRESMTDGDKDAENAFKNVFSNRLFQTDYLIWKRLQSADALGSDLHLKRFRAIAGLTDHSPLSIESVGLVAGSPRSADRLRRAIASMLDGTPVNVHQNRPIKVALEEPSRIGFGRLGRNQRIGSHALDHSGHFMVELGPVECREAEAISRALGQQIKNVIRSLSPSGLTWQVQIMIHEPGQQTRLARSGELGRGASLGKEETHHRLRARRV